SPPLFVFTGPCIFDIYTLSLHDALPILITDKVAAQSKSLFNGKDLSNWHVDVPTMDTDPQEKSPFIIRDGMLVSLGDPRGHLIRSEEHTSELQSRENLVCRLLLEKKKEK